MKQTGARRAYDAGVREYARCGLVFVLGLAIDMFMAVICLRWHEPGAGATMLLLDGLLALQTAALLVDCFRARRHCIAAKHSVRAAVERHTDGTARLVYTAGEARFALELPRGAKLPECGMIDVWHDPRCPRAVYPGRRPQVLPVRRFAAALLPALLAGVANLLFFVVL